MNEVNKTLYIPLYGKAYVSRKGIILEDKKAEDIWASQGFPLKGKSKSKWLAYYMGIRAAVFDQWAENQMADVRDSVVIHIGCGMDSRVLRVEPRTHMWYDVDFPQVIDERKRYFSESDSYKMLAADVRDNDWLKFIPERKHAIVVMEGMSMYLKPKELLDLTARLCAHFEQISLLMDCYTVLAAKLSKYKNPINDVGVTKVFGIDEPATLQHGNFVFASEHEITPKKFIDELSGTEKFIFKHLFAGCFAKKMYKLYEYRTV